MPRAVWNGVIIAEAPQEQVEIVEGNVYFPPDAVRAECLASSDLVTTCGWKGSCNYYHVHADGQVNRDAAWTYRAPLPAARQIRNYIAFWHGVRVEG